MLYCTQPELIFVKTRKTAGSTTEAVLEQALFGVPLPEDDESWQIFDTGFCTPRARTRPPLMSSEKDRLRRQFGWTRERVETISTLKTHAPPHLIRAALGEEIWSTSLKVVNVRNPFDLLISMYFFRPMDPRPPFEEWVMSHPGLNPDSPLGILMNDVSSSVGDDWFVIRHETLADDLHRLIDTLGLPRDVEIPQFKSSTRSASDRDYTTFYSAASRRRVEEAWPEWFERFDYHF